MSASAPDTSPKMIEATILDLRFQAAAFETGDDAAFTNSVADMLEASAADRDDARRELAEQKRINASNLRVMTEQLELARQTIADAPHAIGCSWFATHAGLSCKCWKSQ